MGLVTFRALPGVVVLGNDLLEPLGPGRIGFVATEAKVVGRLGGSRGWLGGWLFRGWHQLEIVAIFGFR